VHQVSAIAALVIGGAASLLTVGTAFKSGFHLTENSAVFFERQVGESLYTPALLAIGGCVAAAALLRGMVRQPRPVFAWASTALSVAALLVSVMAIVEHRKNLDPRPELAAELATLNLGADATVVLRTSRRLPDHPSVRWVYQVPLRQADACQLVRSTLESWADRHTLSERTFYNCHLYARRAGHGVSVSISPVLVPPDSLQPPAEVGDAPVHYVMVEILG